MGNVLMRMRADFRLGKRSISELRPTHLFHHTDMATILRRSARVAVFRDNFKHGTRSMSSQFGFGSPFPSEQQRQQAPQAFVPLPYVTESVVCLGFHSCCRKQS